MSLERKDAINLAKVLAARLGAEPEKWGKAIEQASHVPTTNPCGANYGPLLPGAALKTMNIMHAAVNGGNAPISEQESRDVPCDGYICNGVYDAIRCASSQQTYHLCSCQASNGFDCAVHNQFDACCVVCPNPNEYGCGTFACDQGGGLFKCLNGFRCSVFGGCSSTFEQKNSQCPVIGGPFSCPSFQCSENEIGNDFGCTTTAVPPPFKCSQKFSCFEGSGGGHRCSGEAGFSCLASAWFNCWEHFDCSEVIKVICRTFNCDKSGNEWFSCGGSEGFSACLRRVTCDWETTFTCENYMVK